MNRREFLAVTGTALAPLQATTGSQGSARETDRDVWVAVMRRLADPVLRRLAAGTLKARMPVEQQ